MVRSGAYLLGRLRRNPKAYWVAACLVSVFTVGVQYRAGHRAEIARRDWGEQITVNVAARNVEAGVPLRPGDIASRAIPRIVLPSAEMVADPVGRVSVGALSMGEVLLASRFAASGRVGASARLTAGFSGVGIAVHPGDLAPITGTLVDVWSVEEGVSPSAMQATIVVRGALVIDRDEDTLTVSVPNRDVSAVIAAVAQNTALVALSGPP